MQDRNEQDRHGLAEVDEALHLRMAEDLGWLLQVTLDRSA